MKPDTSQKPQRQPVEPTDAVDETSEKSFPASDPPSWTVATGEKGRPPEAATPVTVVQAHPGALQSRLEAIAREITPHARVELAPAQASNHVAFTIRDENTGTILASGELSAHALAHKSDDWLRHYICNLGGGDI